VLFFVDPPFLSSSHPGGPIGRVSRVLLASPAFDGLRVALYYGLALLAAVRFTARLDAGFWVVAAGVVLSMKQQIPWEKYLLPTLSALWLLRAAGELRSYGEGERTASTSNEVTKQSAPISRFNT
jgi:peptidoglycan hydrolase-like amidase